MSGLLSYGPLGEPQKLVQVEPEVSPSRFLPTPAHRLVVLPSASEASPLVPPMLRPGPGSAARFIFIYTLLTCVHRRGSRAPQPRGLSEDGEPSRWCLRRIPPLSPRPRWPPRAPAHFAALGRRAGAKQRPCARVVRLAAPARSLTLRALASWVATLALNFPWLPWLLWMDYGFPIFECAPRQRSADRCTRVFYAPRNPF